MKISIQKAIEEALGPNYYVTRSGFCLGLFIYQRTWYFLPRKVGKIEYDDPYDIYIRVIEENLGHIIEENFSNRPKPNFSYTITHITSSEL